MHDKISNGVNEMDLERDRIRIEGNLRLIEENRQKRDQLQAEFDEIKTRHGGISQEEQARLREIERLIRQLDAETARLKQENQSITP